MPTWLKITAATTRRITGIATPFGGISWADPGPTDAEKVRKFIIFLEDRRVLYNAMYLEHVPDAEFSIREIRKQCSETLQILSPEAFASAPVRAIREGGRRFDDDQNERFRFFDRRRDTPHGGAGFFTALGAFRATVGQQVALLSAYYDIDVEGDLAAVLPRLEEPLPLP